MGWLEELRNHAAALYPCSLDITSAEPGARTPWLCVGRFTFDQAISYAELGEVIGAWEGDYVFAARVNPQRLSQIRIVYHDPRDIRSTSDTTISKVGAWEYILSALLQEVIGHAPDDPDALAVRYESTAIQVLYVYFAADVVHFETVGPWASTPATQTVKLR